MMGRNHVAANVATAYTLSNVALMAQTTEVFSNFPVQLPAAKGIETVAITSLTGLVPITCALVALVAFLLGSLLPDIDSPTSLVGRWFKGIFNEHRGITHTIWALLLFGMIWAGCAAAFGNSAGLLKAIPCAAGGLFFGYLGHLFWDSLSRSGIAWFYPISGYITYSSGARIKKGFHPWIYRTNSMSEGVVIGVLTALIFITAIVAWLMMPAVGVESVQGAVDDVVLNGAASIQMFANRLVMFVVNPFVLVGIL